jgi:excinuclease ABC subunit C
MEKASKELDYEKAAITRDKIKALTQIQSSQRINQTNLKEADVISIFKESGKTCVQIFFFSSKQNWGNQAYFPKHDSDEKIISELAEKNAKQALAQKILETESNSRLIDNLSDKFLLNSNISLLEVYDNSHIQGSDSVGALISFGREGFIKKRYRKFNIKSDVIKGDDYGMMKEILKRRFLRVLKDEKNNLSLPDLVLIDGGKGQYSVSRETLNDLGLHELPIIAIAKGKNRNAGNETFFHEGKVIKFKKNDPTLFFLQRLRDEAHRFAISAHRIKRRKSLSKSLLDQISGIGKNRKRALLNHFGSAKLVESASFEELKSVDGVEEKVAKKIYEFFHEN